MPTPLEHVAAVNEVIAFQAEVVRVVLEGLSAQSIAEAFEAYLPQDKLAQTLEEIQKLPSLADIAQ